MKTIEMSPRNPTKPKLEDERDYQKRLRRFESASEEFIPLIRYVQIQTHSRCNADCIFCPYIESWHAQNPGRMTDQLWNRILDELTPFASGINHGKFLPYLMQEPLIDPTIFSKIEEVYRRFPQTCLEISTNGMALTPKIVDRLLETFSGKNRKHEIWISHHGVDQASFEKIMALDYERSHRQLVDLLKKAEGRLRIRIRGMGQRRDGAFNFFTADQYREHWRRVFAQYSIDSTNIKIDAYTFHDRASTLYRTDRGANQLNIDIRRKINPENRFYCPRIDLWLHIMWDGTFRLCCMDYHGEVPLPNIQEVSLREYFLSEAYQSLYNKVTGLQESEDQFLCKRCSSPGG